MKKLLIGLLAFGTITTSFASPTTAYYSCENLTKKFVIVQENETNLHIASSINAPSTDWELITLTEWFSGTKEEGGGVARFSKSGTVTFGIPANMLELNKAEKGTVSNSTWENGVATKVEKFSCIYIPVKF